MVYSMNNRMRLLVAIHSTFGMFTCFYFMGNQDKQIFNEHRDKTNDIPRMEMEFMAGLVGVVSLGRISMGILSIYDNNPQYMELYCKGNVITDVLVIIYFWGYGRSINPDTSRKVLYVSAVSAIINYYFGFYSN